MGVDGAVSGRTAPGWRGLNLREERWERERRMRRQQAVITFTFFHGHLPEAGRELQTELDMTDDE